MQEAGNPCAAYLGLPQGQGWAVAVGKARPAGCTRPSLLLTLRGVLPCSYRHK